MARTIESPGVEILERDLSLIASLPIGTNIFVQGFADSGPTDELINVTSISEFEQIYGKPTTAAERYFYHTSRRVLDSPGNLVVNRLPYGEGDGDGYGGYSALLYPVQSLSGGVSAASYALAETYEIGEPVHINLTTPQFMAWKSGQIDWSSGYETLSSTELSAVYTEAGKFGIIVVNEAQTVIDDNHQGYYLAIADNTAGSFAPTYSAIQSVQHKKAAATMVADLYQTIPEDVLEFSLTGIQPGPTSMSEIVESIPTFDAFNNDAYKDSIVIQLFRLRNTLYGSSETTTLDMIPVESYLGSLDATRKWTPPTGGEGSFFIANHVNEKSNYLKMYVNPYIASRNGAWSAGSDDGSPLKTVETSEEVKHSFGLGPVVLTSDRTKKDVGNIVDKLERSMRLAENKDLVPLDIIVDGGLSTVWSVVGASSLTNKFYDDTEYLDVFAELPGQRWKTIFDIFQNFTQEQRKDCIFISDPLRHIFVQGTDQKVLSDPTKNFSADIYKPLRTLFGAANSNYACTYGNWVKRYDNQLGDFVWLPFSGYQANIMANLDANLQPWFAAAGLNNGIVRDVVDIAINPTQKQRDLLYKINVNPVVFFPGDGYTVWGQKTLQKKPSAFDRINVRRLFLVLEKATLAIMKYFVFEPNTVFTRSRVVNVLSPIFDIAKNNEGVYDYMIICDERNNTPNVIDNNEMVVDIYIKPVRIAEYILVNFIATRTDQDFTELL